MARSLPSTIGGVTVVDFEVGPGKTITTLQGAWDWIYTNYPNLVSANRIVRAIVTGMASQNVDSVSVGGSITSDATRYVMFVAALGNGLCDKDPITAPLCFDASCAGFQSTAGTGRPGFTVPAQYTGDLHLEGLQFRCEAVGDQRAADFHASVSVYSRSCLYFHDQGFGVGGSCLRWAKKLTSYNDVFAHPYGGYISALDPVKATTVAHVQSVQNATMWGLTGGNFGLGGQYDGDNAASGSKMYNVLILNTSNAGGIPAAWNANSIASSSSTVSGTNPISNLVPDDVIVVNTNPPDLKLKDTATSVKNNGYDNITENPVDFYFRDREPSARNIGAHDPDASAGPPEIEVTDFYASGSKLIIEYDWSSSGTGAELSYSFLIDGTLQVGPFTTSTINGTIEFTPPIPGIYSLEYLKIEDSLGEYDDDTYSGSVEVLGLEGEGDGDEIEPPDVLTLVPASASITSVQSVNLTLTVEDFEGNPIIGVSPSVTSTNTGAATASLVAATDSNGESIITVTGVGAGSTNVYATYNSVSSNNSVITVTEALKPQFLLDKRVNSRINLRIN